MAIAKLCVLPPLQFGVTQSHMAPCINKNFSIIHSCSLSRHKCVDHTINRQNSVDRRKYVDHTENRRNSVDRHKCVDHTENRHMNGVRRHKCLDDTENRHTV